MQPRLMELQPLVIGEVSRYPELGRTFYERGPGRTIEALVTTFERLAARGVLRLDESKLAAAHFNWLVMSTPINQAMFGGQEGIPKSEDLNRYAKGAVTVFLAAFGNR